MAMEARFDNKTNVLEAKIRATHDDSVIYSIKTDQKVFSRTYTYVRDTNPAGGRAWTTVGGINWDKKTFDIGGLKKVLGDIRRKPSGFRNKSRFWKWAENREEYDIVHREDGWEATCTRTGVVEATFSVPYRPLLFGKTTPIILSMSKMALAKDEVFLILVFIYCEIKRQEKTNSSGG